MFTKRSNRDLTIRWKTALPAFGFAALPRAQSIRQQALRAQPCPRAFRASTHWAPRQSFAETDETRTAPASHRDRPWARLDCSHRLLPRSCAATPKTVGHSHILTRSTHRRLSQSTNVIRKLSSPPILARLIDYPMGRDRYLDGSLKLGPRRVQRP